MLTSVFFDDAVCCLIASIEDMAQLGRDPLEDAFILNAVEKRRTEFHAGRNIARKAMAQLGIEGIVMPVENDRLPRWPDGVVGSISHTDNLVGVAVASSSAAVSVGFDIERKKSVEPSLYPQILIDSELQDVVDNPELDPTVYFCSKEAVYKAVFPIHREFFEFRDVLVQRKDMGFVANSCHKSLASSQTIECGTGFIKEHEDHLCSLFLITSRTARG